jgi:transcriptional regulator with XRE-family HTH domain
VKYQVPADFANRIKQLRKKHNLTQAQLGDLPRQFKQVVEQFG